MGPRIKIYKVIKVYLNARIGPNYLRRILYFSKNVIFTKYHCFRYTTYNLTILNTWKV